MVWFELLVNFHLKHYLNKKKIKISFDIDLKYLVEYLPSVNGGKKYFDGLIIFAEFLWYGVGVVLELNISQTNKNAFSFRILSRNRNRIPIKSLTMEVKLVLLWKKRVCMSLLVAESLLMMNKLFVHLCYQLVQHYNELKLMAIFVLDKRNYYQLHLDFVCSIYLELL